MSTIYIQTHTFRMSLKFCGLTEYPKEEWMIQMARNLTDPIDGFFKNSSHCIMDNDTIFSRAFKSMLIGAKVKPINTCIKTPNMNTYIERYFLTFKTEVMKWFIPQSEMQFRRAVKEWLLYYNSERNHQGINEEIINPDLRVGTKIGKIKCRSRLGNTLNYYYRSVA